MAHEDGGDGASDDGHDEVGGGSFGMVAEVADGEGEDGGEHDAFAEVAEEERWYAKGGGCEEYEEHGEGGEEGGEEEEAVGLDAVHGPAACHASEHEESHAAEGEDEGGLAWGKGGGGGGVVDEEAVEACLGGYVEEEGDEAEGEVGMSPEVGVGGG